MSHRVSDVKPVVMSCYPFKVAPERRFVPASFSSSNSTYLIISSVVLYM